MKQACNCSNKTLLLKISLNKIQKVGKHTRSKPDYQCQETRLSKNGHKTQLMLHIFHVQMSIYHRIMHFSCGSPDCTCALVRVGHYETGSACASSGAHSTRAEWDTYCRNIMNFRMYLTKYSNLL